MATYTTTAKWLLRKLTGANFVSDIDAGFDALAEDLDPKLTPYDAGALGSRPTSTSGSPGKAGRTYRDTSTGVVYLDIGTGWVPVGSFQIDLAASGDATFGDDVNIGGDLAIVGEVTIGNVIRRTGGNTWMVYSSDTGRTRILSDDGLTIRTANDLANGPVTGSTVTASVDVNTSRITKPNGNPGLDFAADNGVIRTFSNVGFTSRNGSDSGDALVVGSAIRASSGSWQRPNGNDGLYMDQAGNRAYMYFTNGLFLQNDTGSGGAPISASAFNVTSDERLKNILAEGELTEALQAILALRVIRYQWKTGDQQERRGLVAQDVQDYRPELVGEREAMPWEIDNVDGIEPDDTILSVDYQGFIPDLIAVAQAQAAQIADLKARVEQLEAA